MCNGKHGPRELLHLAAVLQLLQPGLQNRAALSFVCQHIGFVTDLGAFLCCCCQDTARVLQAIELLSAAAGLPLLLLLPRWLLIQAAPRWRGICSSSTCQTDTKVRLHMMCCQVVCRWLVTAACQNVNCQQINRCQYLSQETRQKTHSMAWGTRKMLCPMLCSWVFLGAARVGATSVTARLTAEIPYLQLAHKPLGNGCWRWHVLEGIHLYLHMPCGCSAVLSGAALCWLLLQLLHHAVPRGPQTDVACMMMLSEGGAKPSVEQQD
jgi:hypothetical protein